MESKYKFLGHPIHPILIVFPLGLLGTSTAFDYLALFTRKRKYLQTAFDIMTGGIVTGALAATFGLFDWLNVPNNTRAKQIGLLHAATNATMLSLFTASWLSRRESPKSFNSTACALSTSGMLLSVVGGWLGGELVDRLGVGVDKGANLNAPSSLSGEDAYAPNPEVLAITEEVIRIINAT